MDYKKELQRYEALYDVYRCIDGLMDLIKELCDKAYGDHGRLIYKVVNEDLDCFEYCGFISDLSRCEEEAKKNRGDVFEKGESSE